MSSSNRGRGNSRSGNTGRGGKRPRQGSNNNRSSGRNPRSTNTTKQLEFSIQRVGQL